MGESASIFNVPQTKKRARARSHSDNKTTQPKKVPKPNKEKTVTQAFAYIQEKAKVGRMRTQIIGTPTDPEATRPRGRSHFCYTYYLSGECPNGTNCEFTHINKN